MGRSLGGADEQARNTRPSLALTSIASLHETVEGSAHYKPIYQYKHTLPPCTQLSPKCPVGLLVWVLTPAQVALIWLLPELQMFSRLTVN
jgi:hypothetical protein